MLIILPILCFIVVFGILYQMRGFLAVEWRESFLLASIIWGIFVTVMTEALSIFKLLEFNWVLGMWLVLDVGAAVVFFRLRRSLSPLQPLRLPHLSPFLWILLAWVGTVVTTLAVIALIAPPNFVDSMAYHMSRVMHWIQNGSVAFYPTHIQRQLYMPPWAGYAITHFQLLVGSDRFANFVQWYSMVGSLVGVTLIAKHLGAHPRGQILSAVLCAALPLGIWQASATYTDYVVAFWLVCFVYFALSLRSKPSWLYALAGGASLGLAILSKPTAYFYAFPFLVWLGVSAIVKFRWQIWKFALLGAILALALNLGFYIRNYNVYGSPFGPFGSALGPLEGSREPSSRSNAPSRADSVALKYAAKVTKHLSMYVGTPFEQVNDQIEWVLRAPYWLIGTDIDAVLGISYWQPKLTVSATSFRGGRLGQPLYLVLAAVIFAISLFKRSVEQREWLKFLRALAAGFLIYVFYMPWHPWDTRLHLGLFVLATPVIAVALAQVRRQSMVVLLISVMVLLATPGVLWHGAKPLLGPDNIFNRSRAEQYFTLRPHVEAYYRQAARSLSEQRCLNVGLITREGSWEYPLWALTKADNPASAIRFYHVNVQNPSNTLVSETTPDSVDCVCREDTRNCAVVTDRSQARITAE